MSSKPSSALVWAFNKGEPEKYLNHLGGGTAGVEHRCGALQALRWLESDAGWNIYATMMTPWRSYTGRSHKKVGLPQRPEGLPLPQGAGYWQPPWWERTCYVPGVEERALLDGAVAHFSQHPDQLAELLPQDKTEIGLELGVPRACVHGFLAMIQWWGTNVGSDELRTLLEKGLGIRTRYEDQSPAPRTACTAFLERDLVRCLQDKNRREEWRVMEHSMRLLTAEVQRELQPWMDKGYFNVYRRPYGRFIALNHLGAGLLHSFQSEGYCELLSIDF
jgi:hypothetical protein